MKNNTLLFVFLGYLQWYAAALSPSYSLSCVPPSLHQIHPIQIFSFNIVSNLLHAPPPMQFFMSSLFLIGLSSYSPPLTPFCASVTFCFLRHLGDSVHLQYGGLLGSSSSKCDTHYSSCLWFNGMGYGGFNNMVIKQFLEVFIGIIKMNLFLLKSLNSDSCTCRFQSLWM